MEFEGLVKIGFAESGTKAEALATLAAIAEWARERNQENLAVARACAAELATFPSEPGRISAGRGARARSQG